MMDWIDSHQHFWSLARGDYTWLTPDIQDLYRDFAPAHLAPLLSEANVKSTILVQAAATTAETEYLLEIASECEFVAGVVGWVDFEKPSAAIDDLHRFAQYKKFVGIRPMIQDIEDPEWMLHNDFSPVFDKLIELDLRFDALVKTAHLPFLRQLLLRHENLMTVVDHGAKPNIAEDEWGPWSNHIADLSQLPNVYCKLSGLSTAASPGQSSDALFIYANYLLRCFGASRLMWGSDWPVVNLNSSYPEWHQGTSGWLAGFDADDGDNIRRGTAAAFYRLPRSGS